MLVLCQNDDAHDPVGDFVVKVDIWDSKDIIFHLLDDCRQLQ
jgi:hypothetical protein